MQHLKTITRFKDSITLYLREKQAMQQLEQLIEGISYGSTITPHDIDQLAKPDPAKIIEYYGEIDDIDAARRFGTEDLNEYSFWSWRSCGVANVMSILKSLNLYDGTLYQLVKEISDANGYLHVNKYGQKDIGWLHASLVEAFAKRGVKSEIVRKLSISELLVNISRGSVMIASIQSQAKEDSTHMIIIYSFEWLGEDTILHIFDPYSLHGHGGLQDVSLEKFTSRFLKRGIIVWPQKTIES